MKSSLFLQVLNNWYSSQKTITYNTHIIWGNCLWNYVCLKKTQTVIMVHSILKISNFFDDWKMRNVRVFCRKAERQHSCIGRNNNSVWMELFSLRKRTLTVSQYFYFTFMSSLHFYLRYINISNTTSTVAKNLLSMIYRKVSITYENISKFPSWVKF